MNREEKKDLRMIFISVVAGLAIAAIGASAKAIIDVNILKVQRIEDVKSIEGNGQKIDKLQEEMNDNFKTVIKLLK